MPRTIKLSDGREITATGEKDDRGFDIFRGSGDSLITKQGGRFIESRAPRVKSPTGATGTGINATSTPRFQNTTGQAPIRNFLAGIQDMLVQYQGVRGNQLGDFDKRQRGLQEQATGAVLEETPEELRRFSPQTQAAIRGAKAGEGAAEFDVVVDERRRADARAQAFLETKDAFLQTSLELFGDELNRPKDAVLSNYEKLLQRGTLELADIPATHLPFLLETLDVDALPQSHEELMNELELKKLQYEVSRLGELSPAEQIELRQYALENFPDDPDRAYQILQGGGNSNFRTDRHNNPAAFTTDIAKQAGLKLGVDYEVGDPFPNNPNLFTARLLGDGYQQTIQVIDKIGFKTQGGRNRWSYTDQIAGANNAQWKKLSNDEKVSVVAKMYRFEGGSGSLSGGEGSAGFLRSIVPANRFITGEKFDDEVTLRKEYEGLQQVKEYNAVAASYGRVRVSAEEPSAAGDLSIIFNYMKMLDPNSVVRESEFKSAATSRKVLTDEGVPTFILNARERIVTGGRLFPEQREDFVDRAERLFEEKKRQQQVVEDFYKGIAIGSGHDPDRIVNPNQFFASDAEVDDYTSQFLQGVNQSIPPNQSRLPLNQSRP